MTLSDFKDTIEIMRKVYSFTDERTELVSIFDIRTSRNGKITLSTIDEETDTAITMEKCLPTHIDE